jgi:hypothetical protein
MMPNRGTALQRIPELREMEQAAGRGHIPVTYYPREAAAEIERAAETGVERCIFYVPADGPCTALTKLNELARLDRAI